MKQEPNAGAMICAEVMKAKEALEEAQDLLDWVADNDGLLTTSEEEAFLRLVESVTDSYERTQAEYDLDFDEDRPDNPDEAYDGDDDGETQLPNTSDTRRAFRARKGSHQIKTSSDSCVPRIRCISVLHQRPRPNERRKYSSPIGMPRTRINGCLPTWPVNALVHSRLNVSRASG